jgi:hypothetical protein
LTGSLAKHGVYFDSPRSKNKSSQKQLGDKRSPYIIPKTSYDAANLVDPKLHESSKETRGLAPPSIYVSTPDRYSVASRGRDVLSNSSSFSAFEHPRGVVRGPALADPSARQPASSQSAQWRNRQGLPYDEKATVADETQPGYDAANPVDPKLHESSKETRGLAPPSIYVSTPDRYSVASRGRDVLSNSSSFSAFEHPRGVVRGPALADPSARQPASSQSAQWRNRQGLPYDEKATVADETQPGYDAANPVDPKLHESSKETRGLAPPSIYVSTPDQYSVASRGRDIDVHRSPQVSVPRLTLPSYFQLLDELMQEIGSLVAELYHSLESKFAQSIFGWSSEHSEQVTSLRQKLRSAELLTVARLGMDKACHIRPSFQEMNFGLASFVSSTNSYELQALLHNFLGHKQFILKRYLELEDAAQGLQFKNELYVSHNKEYSVEANPFANLGAGALNRGAISGFHVSVEGNHITSSQRVESHILGQQISHNSSSTGVSPEYHGTVQRIAGPLRNVMHDQTASHKVNQSVARAPVNAGSHYAQPDTKSQVIHVTLQRTNVGLGITLTQSKSDVMIAAVATGSAAHR